MATLSLDVLEEENPFTLPFPSSRSPLHSLTHGPSLNFHNQQSGIFKSLSLTLILAFITSFATASLPPPSGCIGPTQLMQLNLPLLKSAHYLHDAIYKQLSLALR